MAAILEATQTTTQPLPIRQVVENAKGKTIQKGETRMSILLNITVGVALGIAAFYVFLRHQKAQEEVYAVCVVKNDAEAATPQRRGR